MEETPEVSAPEKDEKKKRGQDQSRREFIKKMAYVAPSVTTLLIAHDLFKPGSADGQEIVCINQCAVCINQCGSVSPCRTFQPCRRVAICIGQC